LSATLTNSVTEPCQYAIFCTGNWAEESDKQETDSNKTHFDEP